MGPADRSRFLENVNSSKERARYSEAIADCDRYVELFSMLCTTCQAKGISFVQQGRLDEANKAWLDATEYNLKLARVYCQRGTAYYQLGDYRRAFSDFDKTVEMEPENVVALHNRGCANQCLGRFREAESDFTKAQRLSADLATAYTNPEVFSLVSQEIDDPASN